MRCRGCGRCRPRPSSPGAGGGVGAPTPRTAASPLGGRPDSLYLAAIWGRWRPSVLTDAMKADMEYVQRVKGTKVVCTTITGWVGVDVIGGDYQNNPQKEVIPCFTISFKAGNFSRVVG